MYEDLREMSAGELAAAIAARQLSASEAVQAMLAQIERYNPTLNAICTLNEQARADAEAIDHRLASGEPARALEGVPFVVKDNIFTKGLRTTFGSKLLEHEVPEEDSICVERLRAAGGVLIGKTNTPEFAHDVNTTNAVFGTTRNPWQVNCTAGGSSGGTGSALAARMAPIGLGTDLGGSIRIPCAFNGLSGIRPAPGRVAFYPTEFGWDTLVAHVQGPMARRVADVGLMLSIVAGPDDRDPMSLPEQGLDFAKAAREVKALRGKRVAFSIDLKGLVPVEPEVEVLTRQAAQQFEALGCEVREDFFDTSMLREIIHGTRGFGMIGRYAERYDRHKDQMTPPLLTQIEAAFTLDVRDVTRSERLRTEYWQQVRRFLARYDYILTPACGAPAFRLDQPLPTEVGGRQVERYYDIFLTTYAFSVTGLPAMAVPCGFTQAGLPVGLQIVGPRLREDLVLQAAAAYAAACPQHFGRPEIDLTVAVPLDDVFSSPGFVVR
jgi:amidase